LSAGDYCTQYGAAGVAVRSPLVKNLFGKRRTTDFKPRTAR
jgi:hypothetical protein